MNTRRILPFVRMTAAPSPPGLLHRRRLGLGLIRDRAARPLRSAVAVDSGFRLLGRYPFDCSSWLVGSP
jgi:hypothetical protein